MFKVIHISPMSKKGGTTPWDDKRNKPWTYPYLGDTKCKRNACITALYGKYSQVAQNSSFK